MYYTNAEYKENIKYMMYYLSGFTQYLYDEVYESVYNWLMTAEDIEQVYGSLVLRYEYYNIIKALDIYAEHKEALMALNAMKLLTPALVHEYILTHKLIDTDYDLKYLVDDIVITMIVYAKAKGVYNVPAFMYNDHKVQNLLPMDSNFSVIYDDWHYKGFSSSFTVPLIYALHTYQNLTGSHTFDDVLDELKYKHIDKKVIRFMPHAWDEKKLLKLIIDAEYDDRFKLQDIAHVMKMNLKFNSYEYINKDESACIELINDVITHACDIHRIYEPCNNEDLFD